MTGHAPFAVLGYLWLGTVVALAIGAIYGLGVLVGVL